MSSTNLQGTAFATSQAMVQQLKPSEPVYCFYPHVFKHIVKRFLDGFPGTVMYAVKANPHEEVLRCLYQAGVRHFDVASIVEMELVKRLCPKHEFFFMAPVRLRGALGQAFNEYGVRNFVVDHVNEWQNIAAATNADEITAFVRMASHDPDAMYDLSTKFGATPEQTIELLQRVAESGATPGLAFNVGSLVLKPSAYTRALEACAEIIHKSDVDIQWLDLGGGFPSAYPGLATTQLDQYFEQIKQTRANLPLSDSAQLLAEPGRALVCEGMSVVAEVILRKDDRLYLNDGIWGSFIEPMLSKGQVIYPTRCYHQDTQLLDEQAAFTLYGPTCDSTDTFPAPFQLPQSINIGDWIEFGMMGAYSLTNRTGFNGFYPEQWARIEHSQPPLPNHYR